MDMTQMQIRSFTLVMVSLFGLSLIHAISNTYPNFNSAFELGKTTGLMFQRMIKILGMVGFIFLGLQSFKRNILLKG